MAEQLTQSNHYVPQSYLRRWANRDSMLWASRLLVPDARMPLWKQATTRGLAKHQNLYTRIIAGKTSDEIERWLNEEFETPAQASIDKVVSNSRLISEDWQKIIRFVAAQDVRTPARLIESIKRWDSTLQTLIDEVLEDAVKEFTQAKRLGVVVNTTSHPHSSYFPIKVSKELNPDEQCGTLKVETVAGRGLWLFSLRHLLTATLRVLLTHKWTILLCPKDLSFITSDDPVVKLNYHAPESYDFKGGWGSKGTEIFMPLSPRHLLYARVGHNPPPRNTVLSYEMAQQFQRLIAEHAHRFVFSDRPDEHLPEIRRRHVNLEAYLSERKMWEEWHDMQVKAEQDLR